MADPRTKTNAYFATDYEDAIRYIEHCKQFDINITFIDWTHNQIITDEKTSNISTEVKITRPGVFKKDTEIFVVKMNREKTRLYALKLVEAPSTRLTESGAVVDFEFEYAKGAIYKLSEENRMSLEEAKEYTIKYGRCIVCGRRLKRAESVERGIGPVCIKTINGEY
jgi:NADH pyrophosphatase NudC (nudix superfamily)